MSIERRLLEDVLLSAYHEIVPDPSARAHYLMKKLAVALYDRGARIAIGEIHPPPMETIFESLDADRRLVWTGKKWHRVMGYPNRYAIGHPISEFLTPDSTRFVEEVAWPELLREGKIGPVTVTFQTSKGEILPAIVRSEILRDEAGDFVRTFTRIRIRLPLLHPYDKTG